MSKSTHKSQGGQALDPSSRTKPLAPKIDISDIQLRRTEKASSRSESAWKFLDQPTARSGLLRDEPDQPHSAGRPVGAPRAGRELGASFSGPRILAGSGPSTQKRPAVRTNSLHVVVLPEPSFMRKFSSALAPNSRAAVDREPASQRTPMSERSLSQPQFDIDALLNEKVNRTFAQQRLSKFLKNTGFTCSPKKRPARSVDQQPPTQRLINSLKTRPETLHQSLRDKILEKLAEPDSSRKPKENRPKKCDTKPQTQASKQPEPRNLVLRRRAYWSDKKEAGPSGPCPSPQRDKTKIAQSTVTGADFSFISQHAAGRPDGRRKSNRSNRSISLFEVNDDPGTGPKEPAGWQEVTGLAKAKSPVVHNKYTSAFKANF